MNRRETPSNSRPLPAASTPSWWNRLARRREAQPLSSAVPAPMLAEKDLLQRLREAGL
jgi:hypothetical protein